jgi:hypothetical protein
MSDAPPITYCANHPQTPTTLRCNRCGKPICPKCAVLTPTGYRCKECVRGQQKNFDTAYWYDYLTSFVLAGVLSYIGARFIPLLGFFTIFLAPIAGVAIAEAVRFVVRRRRSRRLPILTTLAAVLGSLPLLLIYAIAFLGFLLQGTSYVPLDMIWQGVYTFMVASSLYYRLAGIRIRG